MTGSWAFRGLEYNNGGSSFLDGSIDSGSWWFSIGAKQAHSGGIPGPSGTVVSEVKLYVKAHPPTPNYEQTYSCVGTHVTAFPGQHVTILNDLGSSVSIFDIEVTGDELACPYYGFSDDDGNFEIEIHEATGVSQKKTKVAVRAFKTDVFDPEDVSVFTPMEEGSNDSVTIKSPEAVLIALEYDDTSSSSGSSSLATAAELGASTGTDCDYSKTSNKYKQWGKTSACTDSGNKYLSSASLDDCKAVCNECSSCEL